MLMQISAAVMEVDCTMMEVQSLSVMAKYWLRLANFA